MLRASLSESHPTPPNVMGVPLEGAPPAPVGSPSMPRASSTFRARSIRSSIRAVRSAAAASSSAEDGIALGDGGTMG